MWLQKTSTSTLSGVCSVEAKISDELNSPDTTLHRVYPDRRASELDVDVSALRVSVAQPFDCLLDPNGALPFPKDHLADGAPMPRSKRSQPIAPS